MILVYHKLLHNLQPSVIFVMKTKSRGPLSTTIAKRTDIQATLFNHSSLKLKEGGQNQLLLTSKSMMVLIFESSKTSVKLQLQISPLQS